MKVVNVDGVVYLAEVVETGLNAALELETNFNQRVTKNDIVKYITKRNVGHLTEIELGNLAVTSKRELTQEEKMEFSFAEQTFVLAKEEAVARLENRTFAKMMGVGK